jgi:hypothetical protein
MMAHVVIDVMTDSIPSFFSLWAVKTPNALFYVGAGLIVGVQAARISYARK